MARPQMVEVIPCYRGDFWLGIATLVAMMLMGVSPLVALWIGWMD